MATSSSSQEEVESFRVCALSLSVVFDSATLWTGSSVHGIFQARILEWGLPFPSPRDLPHPGIEPASPMSPALQVDSLCAEPSRSLFPSP